MLISQKQNQKINTGPVNGVTHGVTCHGIVKLAILGSIYFLIQNVSSKIIVHSFSDMHA